ncbi:Haloacid dehalogenase-like hydrolase-domain-containing protein [Collybia nuda]|uniref:Haloacid dehalogenase-like hydrolase-domain-containing protein n=1 Tax=Collybia nuda TaxID=64659 RepID=A0A9P6CNK4_9AGAR|nr:Haloacid dehalogenase-like hydrolase-domain-containing protein [Collybia nuda]
MVERIHAYFRTLDLGHEEAAELATRYYTHYGLEVRGLSRYHNIDPLEFDRQCDGSLPLEDMIKFDPRVRKLIQDIDRSKARVWALTNAYRHHAQRVLKILRLEDQFEGLVFCDYTLPDFVCKPEPAYYKMAMKQANVADPSKCYFIDDNRKNVNAARAHGWGHCVHLCETGSQVASDDTVEKEDEQEKRDCSDTPVEIVTALEGLRSVWPEIFHRT